MKTIIETSFNVSDKMRDAILKAVKLQMFLDEVPHSEVTITRTEATEEEPTNGKKN